MTTMHDCSLKNLYNSYLRTYHNTLRYASISDQLKLRETQVVKDGYRLSAQIKYKAAKKEVEGDSELFEIHPQKIVHRDIPSCDYYQKNEKKNAIEDENIKEFDIHTHLAQKKSLEQRLDDENDWITGTKDSCSDLKKFNLSGKNLVNDMIGKNIENAVLTEMLLYDVRYDTAWKSNYTTKFNKGKMKVTNRAGWVLPLQELCDKIGISSDFFTRNEKVTLDDARSFILYQRLTRIPVIESQIFCFQYLV
ncbi:unnamed protein product [Onchocerca flexuosa]|uniref:HTH cro/C1-type domain-containing protein n=1 Tax=Onchocerca flexuosa TaxID=387005 RepID=A0A183I6J7_9BILA|nr:unnamed protein product [Onchocerca flexuosa]